MRAVSFAIASLCAFVLFAGIAAAQEGMGEKRQQAKEEDSKTKAIREFLRVTKSGEQGIETMRQMIDQTKITMPFMPDAYWERFMSKVTAEDLEELVLPIYAKHFTEEEIRGLIAFYKTPLGLRFLEKSPLVMQETLIVAQEWGMRIGEETIAELQKEGLFPGPGGPPVVVHDDPETQAIGDLRTISAVQAQFREGDREGDRALDYATSMKELMDAQLIDKKLGSGKKGGYVFTLSGSTYEWKCTAKPADKDSDLLSFIICVDGIVRFAPKGKTPDCDSEPVW